MGNGWDIHGAAGVAAGVIPTLLLAMVLESRLLPVAVQFAKDYSKEVENPPKWMSLLMKVRTNPFGLSIGDSVHLSAVLLKPSTIVGLAILAETVAFAGVAVPSELVDEGAGRVVALIGLGFVTFSFVMLLVTVAIGLLDIVKREETADPSGEGRPQAP